MLGTWSSQWSAQVLSSISVSEGFREHKSILEAGQGLPKEHSEVGIGQGKSSLSWKMAPLFWEGCMRGIWEGVSLTYPLRGHRLHSGQDLCQHQPSLLQNGGLLQQKVFGDWNLQVCLWGNMGKEGQDSKSRPSG